MFLSDGGGRFPNPLPLRLPERLCDRCKTRFGSSDAMSTREKAIVNAMIFSVDESIIVYWYSSRLEFEELDD